MGKMGALFGGILGGLVVGGVLYKVNKDHQEEKRRKSIPCCFSDGISKSEFDEVVKKSRKHIKRLNDLYVEEAVVYGTVCSQSGISNWNFNIDFNDYGHLTGKYWLSSENNDSNIPITVAKKISSQIMEFLNSNNDNSECNMNEGDDSENKFERAKGYCSYCGKKVMTASGAKFCRYCGNSLSL